MEEKKTHPEMMKNVVFNKCRIKSGWKEKFIEKKKSIFIHLSGTVGQLHDLSNAQDRHCSQEEWQ